MHTRTAAALGSLLLVLLFPTSVPAQGIVKLSGIAMIDPQHTGFATGLEPIILGVGQPDSA